MISVLAISCPRSPIESSAPDLARASQDFLLKLRPETRVIKSSILVNFPDSLIVERMASITSDPRFFMALSPKRICVSSMTVKLDMDSLTSGGKTSIPSLRHSSTASTIEGISRRLGSHNSRHKFHRVVGFHVCRLVGDHRIRCRMGFVESISCEWLNPRPDLGGFFLAPDRKSPCSLL
jgi:hypothetical protein